MNYIKNYFNQFISRPSTIFCAIQGLVCLLFSIYANSLYIPENILYYSSSKTESIDTFWLTTVGICGYIAILTDIIVLIYLMNNLIKSIKILFCLNIITCISIFPLLQYWHNLLSAYFFNYKSGLDFIVFCSISLFFFLLFNILPVVIIFVIESFLKKTIKFSFYKDRRILPCIIIGYLFNLSIYLLISFNLLKWLIK